jgi:hypothetical protein
MKKFIVIIGIFLLAGCSSKLAYNNLDWLIYWYMDDYVELTEPQEKMFDNTLTSWIDWHRSEQLALYLRQLNELKRDIETNNLNKDTIAKHLNQANEHIITLRQKVAPELAELATRLNDEQVIYLFAAIRKQNEEKSEELIEYNLLSAEEKREKLITQFSEQVEDRLGALTEQQEALIKENAPYFTNTRTSWLAYRITMQNEARKLFARKTDNVAFVRALTDLLQHPDNYRSAEYLAKREENRIAYLQLATELAKTMTPKQKAHLLESINDLIDVVEGLINSAP